MAVVNWSKQVETTPVKLTGRSILGPDKEQRLTLKPGGAVFIGGEDVTVETGIELTSGANNSWQGVGPLYGVSAGDITVIGMNWDIEEPED